MKPLTYTTATGVTVTVKAATPYRLQKIAPSLEAEWTRQHKALPTVPTYKVQTAGGGEEEHEHNLTTLTKDEDRIAWNAYQSLLSEFWLEVTRRQLRLVMATCVDFDMPANDEWVRRQALLSIEVPEGEYERRLHYLETEVIGSQFDIDTIWELAQVASGVTKAAQSAAEKSFPDDVERPSA